MKPSEFYQAGDLKAAVAAALEVVRNDPADVGARNLLCELLCFSGDWERVDKQLDLMSHQDPTAAVGVSLFRQLLRAEEARQQFHSVGRVPEFLDVPNENLQKYLQASILLREKKSAEAAKLLAEAEEKRVKPHGTCDGVAFDDLRDGDDVTAPVFEVLTSTGKYYWIPMERVESVEIRPPARPRDLLWVQAHMIVRDGPDGVVYLPALYAGTHLETDDQLRLGRATDWRGPEGGPMRGVGQRTFLVGNEGKSILEMKEITFEI
jgi:type VI secretion system protein ImpE